MKAAGVVVEYNPFHNGHYYHLQQTKAATGADIIVAAMSGNFLQRGEPAIVSKWARADAALKGGADIVIELPYAFATQNADTFASGSVSILDSMKVDALCFGSEDGKIDRFLHTYEMLSVKEDEFNRSLKESVKEGSSYPRAASDAFESVAGADKDMLIDLTKPNNILGFQYVKSILEHKSAIKPYTVKRTGAAYHDPDLAPGNIASATSIRNNIFQVGGMEEAVNFMPKSTADTIEAYQQNYGLLHNWEHYFPLLKYRLLTMSPREAAGVYEAEEGIENRLKGFITESGSFHEFMEKIKTKRYTWTRLQRLCTHILTNTGKQEMKEAKDSGTVPYLRLLGMTEKGQAYLRKKKQEFSVPLVSTVSRFNHPLIDMDVRAAYAYAAVLDEPFRTRFLKEEFSTPPLQID
ncbi:nucleotidyltransferase [Bacillus marinisedimentorum]|uniref:nucleotidyltransferase n=1 Tax=Bacillus marinisedimentorum TaxID=1821260 RepID=UPI0008720695|nr:nucleotidyltransferase [Bacillus marinisedimentorum]